MVRVGLVGCGTIGTQLAKAIQRDFSHAARLTTLHDRNPAHARALQRRLRGRPAVVPLAALIRRSDLILEAASVDMVPLLVTRALRARRSLLIMSVGGLLSVRLPKRSAASARVYVPSGALAGLDAVKAFALGRISRITLTTRKPPAALAGTAALRRRRARGPLTRPVTVFTGSPRQVITAFPQNTNVAAALALASGVPDARVRVRVVADPAARRNRHTYDVEGDVGRLRCEVESVPSANPKTSELAVRSAVATLHRIFDPVQLGT
jgi:aspartate dehydrogenase